MQWLVIGILTACLSYVTFYQEPVPLLDNWLTKFQVILYFKIYCEFSIEIKIK